MSIHQVNRETLIKKLEAMGVSPKAKYQENNSVMAVEAFIAGYSPLNDEGPMEDVHLTQDEVAFIVMEFAGCRV